MNFSCCSRRILPVFLPGVWIVLIFVSFFAASSCAQSPKKGYVGVAKPVSHATWDQLLRQYVDDHGGVNYKGLLKDSAKLGDYLRTLSQNPPADAQSREDRLAYWINAYNAFTVKLILDHYPVKGIQSIRKGIPGLNSVWDIEFIQMGSQKMSLQHIEHKILRREFDEPRIHFCIVCASQSCPNLRNEAFTGARIEAQLTDQAKKFINDPTKNKIVSAQKASLSKIFSWYEKDFTKTGTLTQFINRYLTTPVSPRVEIDYLPYDWNLNEQK